MRKNKSIAMFLICMLMLFVVGGCKAAQKPIGYQNRTGTGNGNGTIPNNYGPNNQNRIGEEPITKPYGINEPLPNNQNLRMDKKLLPDTNQESKIENSIITLKEVDAANVLLGENNAYVAVKLNENLGTAQQQTVRDRIVQKVKDMDGKIKNVSVSMDENVMTKVKGYQNEIKGGQTIDRFMNDIKSLFRTNY
ncbi:YhcN/YlaJ family sporulation lipoprotein [Lutibacter sp. B2]|nr:YhcN/YlaJ family sporulation lipoprotein [Lutibacter sp. B2]